MKKYTPVIVIFAAFLAVMVFSRVVAPRERIPWRRDFPAAQSESRSSRKPVLLEFTASWCGPCQQMKKTTWADAKVEAALRDFTPVQIDVDEQPQIAQRYGITAVPTLILLDDSGATRKSTSGALGADDLLAWLRAR